MTTRGPLAAPAAAADAEPPAHAGRDTARRVIPLFRPYRGQVTPVVGLIVLTSTIGIVNPLLIQAVFNKALFVPGGPRLGLLYVLVAVMAAVPVVNGAIDGGSVVESGSHRELLGRHGLYASLYNEQFEGGRVQWCCEGGDVMADGSVRKRETLPA